VQEVPEEPPANLDFGFNGILVKPHMQFYPAVAQRKYYPAKLTRIHKLQIVSRNPARFNAS